MVTLVILTGIFAGALGGRIVDDNSGNPIASVEVSVHRAGDGVVAELETDGDGRFEAPELPPGDYRLDLSKPNYMRVMVQARADSALDLRMIRYGVISGEVRDQQGQPVRDVDVLGFTQPPGGGALRFANVQGRTDDHGEYRLHHIPPGQYTVAASWGASTRAVGGTGSPITSPGLGSGFLFYPSHTRPRFFTVTSGDEYTGVDFVVETGPSWSVSGKVDGPATDLARYWVALTPTDQPALAVVVAEAGRDGSFRLTGVPQGSYDLFAAGPSPARGMFGGLLDDESLFGHARVDVGGQDVEGVSLAMAKGRAMSFLLRPDAGCPATANVILQPLEDRGSWRTWSAGVTSAKPTAITALGPGRYVLDVHTAKNACYFTADNVLDLSAKTFEVHIAPAGAIHGHAATAALVTLSGGDTVQMAVPDAEHRFTFTGLRPGHYQLRAADKTTELDVPAGAPIDIAVP